MKADSVNSVKKVTHAGAGAAAGGRTHATDVIDLIDNSIEEPPSSSLKGIFR
jgi:hypothetical protein